METPKSDRQETRTMRNHTPRLSERKKKLFDVDNRSEFGDGEEELLNGIEPLSMRSKLGNARETPNSTKIMESLMGSTKKSARVISFFETESEEGDTMEEQKPSPSRRSVRLSLKQSSKSKSEFSNSQKENIPIKTHNETQEANQLQEMFTNSMQITPRDKSSMVIEETSSEDEIKVRQNSMPAKCLNKRHCAAQGSNGLSPTRKVAKTTHNIDDLSISTKSFYSGKDKGSTENSAKSRQSCRNLFEQNVSTVSTAQIKLKQTPRRSLSSQQSSSINRGVHHKVRKRPSNVSLRPKRYAPVDIDQILSSIRNEKLRKLITAKREEKQQIEKIHSIFRKATNPIAMARPLSSISNQDDSNNNLIKEKEKSMENLKSTEQTNTDFSDIECDETGDEYGGDEINSEASLMSMNEEVIPLITHHGDDASSVKSEESTMPVKRKFFKSGRTTTTRKEVHLTDNIKATITANGKLAIVPEKKKVQKRIKIRNSVGNEFSDEQATVDAILRNLDDTAFGDISLPQNDGENITTSNNNNPVLDETDEQLSLMSEENSPYLIDDDMLQDNSNFNEFRKRLPFNTTDPEVIERQHLLLDFLITNNICTEDNFKIFIADPDNHKADAERIIDELVIVVTDHQNTDFRLRIPYNTTDPNVIEQQHNFLDFLLENNICTEENFDIFIANYSQRKAEATAILLQYLSTFKDDCTENTLSDGNGNFHPNSLSKSAKNDSALTDSNSQSLLTTANETSCSDFSLPENQHKLFPVFYPGGCQPLPEIFTRRKQQQRSWNGGYGSNQYQIDAGQKAFGAHQCKQCGLVYTVHEPEEEKLHRDFHASLHILRFKGWIDEDIVAIYPEWGPDGRILRLTESSPPKRRERLLDILKIVDKELGFSSYIVPKTFVAYFAVRKMQIVGLCLVQPLKTANKYVCVNGVDCCSEKEFEAKCGISRIWVSPLHRRFRIGSKLIQAVQLNTIFGEEISIDQIAFSAPTEIGRAFAQKITKTENFLVYQ